MCVTIQCKYEEKDITKNKRNFCVFIKIYKIKMNENKLFYIYLRKPVCLRSHHA